MSPVSLVVVVVPVVSPEVVSLVVVSTVVVSTRSLAMSTRAARGAAGLPPKARMRTRGCTTVMALAEQPGARCQHRVPAAKAAVMVRASKPAATRVADSLRPGRGRASGSAACRRR